MSILDYAQEVWQGKLTDLNVWVAVPVAVVWEDGTVQTIPPCTEITGTDNDFTLYWKVPPIHSGTIVALVIDDAVSKQRIEVVSADVTICQRVKIDA